jgi:Tol biopolymer transport system component
MRASFWVAIVFFMAIYSPAEISSLSAEVITDPRQITSRSKPDVQRLSIEKLYMTRGVTDSAWSPDGKQVAFMSNISGRYNLWLVSADGGWPTQLTISDQRQFSPAWSPDGRWIAYMSDYDGNEQWDLFLVSPSNGDVINLTNTPNMAEETPNWSPDGEFLAYQVKPRESSTYEIHVMELATRQIRQICL